MGKSVVLETIDSVVHAIPLGGGTWGDIAGPLQFLLLFRLMRNVFRTDRERDTAMRLALWASVPISLIAIAQYVNVPKLRTLIIDLTGSGSAPTHGQGGGGVRTTTLFAHYHSLAGYLVLVLLLATTLLTMDGQQVSRKRWLGAIAFVDFIGLATALTFADLIGLVVGVFIIAGRRKMA